MRISKYLRLYFDANDGGGGGTGDAPAPAPEAPVITGNAELDSFTAPDIDGLDFMQPDGKAPEPKPDPKPPEEKKPEPPKKEEPKKPDAKPPAEPPAKQLREELDRVKAERDEWKGKAENHPRVKELDDLVKAKETEAAELAKQIEEFKKQITLNDPLASEPIRKLQDDFNAKHSRAMEFIPGLEGSYAKLVEEFEALPRNDRAAYKTALDEFENRVEELVGDRKVTSALDIIREGADFRSQYAKAAKEARENAGRTVFEGRQKQWDGSAKLTTEHLSGAFEIPDDLKTAHPYHPILFVSELREGLDDAGKQKDADFDGKVKRYISFAANGVSPKTMAELDSMPASERSERLQEMEQNRLGAAKWVRQMALRAAHYERIMPSFMREFAQLKAASEKKAKALPPDPAKPNVERGGSDEFDSYKPESIPEF
ncbi:MAG: hypothetical protein ACEQSB_05560 [Undibacterium sp.]